MDCCNVLLADHADVRFSMCMMMSLNVPMLLHFFSLNVPYGVMSSCAINVAATVKRKRKRKRKRKNEKEKEKVEGFIV